jgi:hypothetical protein
MLFNKYVIYKSNDFQFVRLVKSYLSDRYIMHKQFIGFDLKEFWQDTDINSLIFMLWSDPLILSLINW